MRYSDLIKQPLYESTDICRYIKDEIPPEIGSVPIPENHIRLLHQTEAYSLEGICSRGLLTYRSRRRDDRDRQVTWASTANCAHGAFGYFHARHTIEFSIDRNDPYITYMGKKDTAECQDCTISRDILLSELIAIHMPWHWVARDILSKLSDKAFSYIQILNYVRETTSSPTLSYQERELLINYMSRRFSSR